jgi:molecular chaperone HscB
VWQFVFRIVAAAFPRNYYDFLGLQRKLTINQEDLQKRFYALSRQWHPDRFSRKGADEQALALEDPIARAQYLLSEEGFSIGEQRSRDVPPELLEEVFELNMMLEGLKEGDESARAQLESAKEHFLGMQTDIDHDLEALFARYDSADAQSATAKQVLHDMRGMLNRRRYIENLIQDVDWSLSPAGTAATRPEHHL